MTPIEANLLPTRGCHAAHVSPANRERAEYTGYEMLDCFHDATPSECAIEGWLRWDTNDSR